MKSYDYTARKGVDRISWNSFGEIISHSWANPKPDISLMISDALVIFPWDELVLDHGSWAPNPEIQEALNKQKGPSQDSNE